jgi:hypothetical protein
VLQFAMNENRYGSQIHRTQDTRFGPKQPESQMGGMSASAISKGIAQGANAVTGGTAAKAGMVDVNPDSIDALAGMLLPGVPAQAVRALSTAKKLASGEETETREYPGIRRIVAEPSKGKVYEALQEAKQKVGELQNMANNGSAADRADLSKNYPGWRGVEASFTVFGKQVGDLQKRKAAIIDGKLKVADEAAEKTRIDHKVLDLQNKQLHAYTAAAARW